MKPSANVLTFTEGQLSFADLSDLALSARTVTAATSVASIAGVPACGDVRYSLRWRTPAQRSRSR